MPMTWPLELMQGKLEFWSQLNCFPLEHLAGIFPSGSKLVRSSVETTYIGIANGFISFGYQIGPAIGTFAGGLLMARFGWRGTFVLFGVLSLLWLVPWSRVKVYESTTREGVGTPQVPPF